MDPRVLAHFDGDLSRANLSPRKRDQDPGGVPAAAALVEEAAQQTVSRPRGRGAVEVLAARCPGCGYTYEVAGRRRARGLRGRHRLEGRPRQLVLPGLRRARQGRLRPARPVAGLGVAEDG